jgi:hypothetical protein
VIAEIDDLDVKAKMIEKFYQLAEKLSIKIITIEEQLLKENVEIINQGQKVGQVQLFDNKIYTKFDEYVEIVKKENVV